MTIEAWIKSNNTSGARVIVSKWDDPAGMGQQSYIFKDHNSSDKLRIELSKGNHNNLADLEGNTSIITEDWIHVAATYDLSTVSLFDNGVLDSFGPPKAPGDLINNSLTDLLIGTVNPFAGFETFNGQIDEVRIWNYARTQQQIQNNRFIALNGDESGLMAYWNFDEGNGQTAFDLTANGNHGQLGSTSGIDINDPQYILSDGTYGQTGNVIPEPSTVLLLSLGFLGAVGFIKKHSPRPLNPVT